VRTDPDPNRRLMAAYALGHIRNKRATAALREVLGDRAQPSAVRGMAAEHLAASFTWDAVPDLVAGLRDPTPEVRFWCAYGVGFLRIRSALPRLRRLTAGDYARVPGWWTVKREARWAIEQIAQGPWER
jgi:HEAT repeat protein